MLACKIRLPKFQAIEKTAAEEGLSFAEAMRLGPRCGYRRIRHSTGVRRELVGGHGWAVVGGNAQGTAQPRGGSLR